jgi:hypothetical protein
MDGVADCLDLDCCPTAPCAGAVASRRLILSEVLYDFDDAMLGGADNRREWVELRNAGSGPVPLSCYAIGNGSLSYGNSVIRLPAMTIPAGACIVIGGPDDCGGSCTIGIDFDPDFLNGGAGGADSAGVALFHTALMPIPNTTVPADAVIYGNMNTGGLLDATGAVPTMAHVADVTAGHSIARNDSGVWVDQASPTPGTCTIFVPP